jgi:hypothetical protein
MPRRWDPLAYSVLVALFFVAEIRIQRVHATGEVAATSDEDAHDLYREVTRREPQDRKAATLRFQGSPWSQQDEFHASEQRTIRRVAFEHHVGISAVVSALDRGMREGWPTEPGVVVSEKVIPCRPRLAY